MNTEVLDRFSVSTCRKFPDHIFVFGDNLIRSGTAGQAVIRKEPNAYGIPTKRYPSMSKHSFFSDKDCERQHVLNALRGLYSLGKTRTIVFPQNGIGTGLANMREHSPTIYNEMVSILKEHFKFNNGESNE